MMHWPLFLRFVGGGLIGGAIGWAFTGRFGPGGLLVLGVTVFIGSFAAESRGANR